MKLIIINTERDLINMYKAMDSVECIVVRNGTEMREKIKANPDTDVVIANAFMAGIGGAEICHEVRKTSYTPHFIILSPIDSTNIAEKCMNYGADQFVLKPYDVNTMLTNVMYECNPRTVEKRILRPKKVTRSEMRDYIRNLLTEIGVHSWLRGYQYIIDSVEVLVDATEPLYMTKDIYPTVAKMNNTKAYRVERCIRTAVRSSCENGNTDVIKMFSYTMNSNTGFPSNTEFLSKIAEKVKIECLGIEL